MSAQSDRAPDRVPPRPGLDVESLRRKWPIVAEGAPFLCDLHAALDEVERLRTENEKQSRIIHGWDELACPHRVIADPERAVAVYEKMVAPTFDGDLIAMGREAIRAGRLLVCEAPERLVRNG